MTNTRRNRIGPHLDPLYGYSYALTSNRELSCALVRDCARTALAARNVPRDDRVFKSWLFGILRNDCSDRLGQCDAQPSTLADDLVVEDWGIGRCDDRVINGLTVRLGLTRLSRHSRELIALIDIAGFGYADAAAFLGLPIAVFTTRLSRARRVLMRALVDGNVRALPQAKQSKSK